MSKKYTILILIILIISISLLLKFEEKNSQIQDKELISINNAELIVEIADEPTEQTQGLSGKDKIGEGEGMLFIFPQPNKLGFWMKEMKFSIDIIWIDESAKIIGVTRNLSPHTYPETVYPPSEIKYVVEVNAGWSDRNKISVGDRLEL